MITFKIFLSFMAFFLYLQLGLFVLFSNVSSKINRSFFYICCCLVIWSFGLIFVNIAPAASVLGFWDKFSSFGWIFFPTMMIRFFIALKRSDQRFFPNLVSIGFMTAAGLFSVQSLKSNLLTKSYYKLSDDWVFHSNSDSIWYWLFLLYLVLAFGYSLYNLIGWSLRGTTIKERRQSQIIMATLIIFFLGIFISEYGLPSIGKLHTPGLIHLLSFVWVCGFGYAIVRYKFLVLTPALAANEIISKMGELLFFVDNTGRIIRVNQFTEEILGFNKDEVMNRPFTDLLTDEDNVSNDSMKLSDDEKERHKGRESYLIQKSGDAIPFNLSQAEIRDDVGDLLGTIVVGHDVRYQKLLEKEIELRIKAEESLIESEDRSRHLYTMVRLMCDNAPDMLWAKDLNSRFIFVNKATYEKLLNAKDSDEPIGKTEQYFYKREKDAHPNNKHWFTFGDIGTDTDAITLRSREPGRFVEVGNIRNSFVYLDVHKAPFVDDNGNLIGIVGCGRDVTTEKRIEDEQRKTQQALEVEKEYLSVTLRAIDEGVISTDKNQRILFINRVAEELTGWKKNEVIGKNISMVVCLKKQETGEKLLLPVSDTLITGKKHYSGDPIVRDAQPILVNRYGKQYAIDYGVTPIKSRANETIGAVVVFSDITNKIRIEREMLKIQRMESMSVLAGGIAHDFNNILTSVVGNLSLSIKCLKDDPTLSSRLKDAEKGCLRARELTERLLSLSKGSLLKKKHIDLEKMLKETASFVLRGSMCNCQFAISGQLYSVEVDETQIYQVIENLVINAEQSMSEGGTVRICAENKELNAKTSLPLAAGKYVCFSVIDNGVGIDKKNLERIFDPFYTTKDKGSGLGLTSCFTIIRKHHGHIDVESKLGVGTKFTVYLPASNPVSEGCNS